LQDQVSKNADDEDMALEK